MTRTASELALVAGLIGHPTLAWEVVDQVPPDVVTDAKLGAVYSVIRDIAERGELPDSGRVRAGLLAAGVLPELAADEVAALHRTPSVETVRDAVEQLARAARLADATELLAGALQDLQRRPDAVDAIWARFLDDATFGLGAHRGGIVVDRVEGYRKALEQMDARNRGELAEAIWALGVRDIDDRLLFGPDMLVLLAGGSGHGKTSAALFLESEMLRANGELGCIHFSFADVSAQGLAERALSRDVFIPTPFINRRAPGAARLAHTAAMVPQLVERYEGRHLFLEGFSKAAEDIVHTARRFRARMAARGVRLGVVGIDYAQRLKLRDKPRGMSRSDELGVVAELFKEEIARALECTVFLLGQYNRDSAGHGTPETSWVRDSSEMEHFADQVLLLATRRLVWDDSNRGPAWAMGRLSRLDVHVPKQRGPFRGVVPLVADGSTCSYWPLTDCPHYQLPTEKSA